MAKKGQHHNSPVAQGKPRGHERSRGHNNPSKSVTITTGSYKKEETYAERAREQKHPDPVAQADKNEWNGEMRPDPTWVGSTRARRPRSGRSGSDSNSSRRTTGH